jgi:hypothetical protein
MLRAGYVTTAPACGDCARSRPEPQGTFCRRHLALVSDDARCLHWQPAAHWLRANPTVAPLYCGLSPSELALLGPDGEPC